MKTLVRRLLTMIPVVIGVTALSFFLIHMIPGDPADLLLGEMATAEDKAILRVELGLDQPLLSQLVSFYAGFFSLDLGVSLFSGQSVLSLIVATLPATVELALAAIFLSIVFGIPLGVFAGIWRGSFFDRVLTMVSLFGLAAPAFWLGPMLILLFSVGMGWFPISDRGGISNLVLPAVTLSSGLLCVMIQVTRAAVCEVIQSDYIRVARAKGVSPLTLYFRHVLANAMIPILSVIGIQMGALLTGAVIVETIFDWPGLGSLLFHSIQSRDYPLVQGCVLVIALIYVSVNFLTDTVYGLANPRLRVSV